MFKVILRNDTENFTHKYFTMESVRKVPLDNDVQLELGERRKIKVFLAQSPQATSPPISTKSGAVNAFRNFRGTSTTKSKQQTCVNTGRYYLFPFIVVLQKCHPIGPFLSPKAIFCSKFCFSFIWSTFRGYGVEVLIPIIYNAIYTSFVHTSSVPHSFDHSLSSSCVHVCIQNLHPIICPNLSTKSTNLTHKQTHVYIEQSFAM